MTIQHVGGTSKTTDIRALELGFARFRNHVIPVKYPIGTGRASFVKIVQQANTVYKDQGLDATHI